MRPAVRHLRRNVANVLRAAAGLAAIAVAIASPPARATERMPRAIATDLGLSYVPECSLCHVGGNAGPGTARSPFALTARSYGLDGSDRTLLQTALQKMEAAKVDSDGDGVPDIAELRAGNDPNIAGTAALIGRPDPSYGCTSASRTGPGALLVLGLLLLRRRPRKPAPPSSGWRSGTR